MNSSLPVPVAIQRADRFVARTMNWMYDHLRHLPAGRYRPVVLTDVLENRAEFPDVEAIGRDWEAIPRRAWQKFFRPRPYPPEVGQLRRLGPRVLHSHFGYVGLGDGPLARALGVPWLVAFYGADVYQHSRRPDLVAQYQLLFRDATGILALGPAMADALVAMGSPREKVIVHPLGVDIADIPVAERRLEPGQPLRILFAGTMREKKGLVYLLAACGMLRRAGVPFQLHLVGDVARASDQEAKEGAEAVIAREGIGEAVVRHSWLQFKELIALALECHVFAAPSVVAADGDAEGTPFVVQQMMATGMPVVSTLHSDIPFLFGPHRHLLVPERDAAAIAERLAGYAASPEAVARDGRLLRQQIETFDVRGCAAALADVYDRVAR